MLQHEEQKLSHLKKHTLPEPAIQISRIRKAMQVFSMKKDRNSFCVWHKWLDTAQEKERFYGIKLMIYVLIWFWNFTALLISQHLENKNKTSSNQILELCFSQNRKYKQILKSKKRYSWTSWFLQKNEANIC